MKIAKTMLAILFIIASFSSCKKDNDSDSISAITGLWHGEYLPNNSSTAYFFGLYVRPNGVLEWVEENGTMVGAGTWKFKNNILTGNMEANGNPFTVVAALYPSQGKLIGDFVHNDYDDQGGEFELIKISNP